MGKLILATVAASMALCQGIQKGTISGTVMDDQGKPAANISVAALNVNESTAEVIQWETTDSDGK